MFLLLMEKWLENESVSKEKWRPGGEELDLDMKGMESKPPPVSIEDRTVVGRANQV